MGDDSNDLFGSFFEPVEMNYRNDLKCATAEDTLQRLESYWWHLYGLKQHRVEAECGGKVTYAWPDWPYHPYADESVTDVTAVAIQQWDMRPIEHESPEGVCSVGDSKGGRTGCCQSNSSQARKTSML